MGKFNTIIDLIYTLSESLKIIQKMKKDGPEHFFYAARNWSKNILIKSKIIVDIQSNNYDRSKSYIIISNHSSFLDIPILLASLEINFVIMYKKELEKIPIFGKGLELSPYISVIRTSPREAVKSLDKAIEILNSGTSVLIFPEGTRSVNGELGEFKKGATRIAFKSNTNILPVKIIDTHKLMPKNTYIVNKGKVRLEIKPELPFSEYKDFSEEQLLKRLKDILSE